MRVVLASDKFKGSLSAAEVASALTRGLHRADPSVEAVRVPVADGGDGTLEAALDAGFDRCAVTVEGPTGERVESAYARRGAVAVVELADASGLARLGAGPAPLHATTVGTGQLIAAAVDAGCREIVLGVGGSSSTDGGAGLAVGLGAQLLDDAGRPVPPGGAGVVRAARLELGPVRARLTGVRITLASDVDNPLLGRTGAVAVYSPQKGAGPDDRRLLEDALTRWADLVASSTGHDLRSAPGAGAAGGAGFGAMALLGATMRSGVETILDMVGFHDVARGADVVVTGEGSIDEQTLNGKAPLGVVNAARGLGIPAVGVCGRTTLDDEALRDAGLSRTWSLTTLAGDPERAMADAAHLLERVGADLAKSLAGIVTRKS